MCSVDEFNLRCQVNNVHEAEREYKPDLTNLVLDSDDNLVLSDDPQVRYMELCQRAQQAIELYEQRKTKNEAMMVKKLVLSLPSIFLKENKAVLRDMPGYDEREEYKQYIKESMMDVGVVFCGTENNRGSWDDRLIKKLWDHGLYSPYQNIFPSVVFLVNDPLMTVEVYNNWNYKDTTNKIKVGIQLSILFGVDVGVSEDIFAARSKSESQFETNRITELLSDCGISLTGSNHLTLEQIKGIVDESKKGTFSKDDFNRLLKRLNDNQSANAEIFESNI